MDKKLIIIVSALVLLLISCGVYHPQMADIHLIDHKGDLRIGVGTSIVPAAYTTISSGLTDKFALQAFGSVGTNKYYFQISPGIYKKQQSKHVLELYSGFGYGHGYENKHPEGPILNPTIYGNYQIYFTQFNWGKNKIESGGLDWGFGIKGGLIHSNLTDQNFYNIYSEAGPFPKNKENNILLEEMFFFRIGFKKVKLSCKLGLSNAFKLKYQDKPIPTSFINIGIGFDFRPGLKKSKD